MRKRDRLFYSLLLAFSHGANFGPLTNSASANPTADSVCALTRFRAGQEVTREALERKPSSRFSCDTPVVSATDKNGKWVFAFSFTDTKTKDAYYVVSDPKSEPSIEIEDEFSKLTVPVIASREFKPAQRWTGILEFSSGEGSFKRIREVFLNIFRKKNDGKKGPQIGGIAYFREDDADLLSAVHAVATQALEQKQKNKDGCRDGKPCCYEVTNGSRTFFNPKRIFSKTRTLHKQCKESAVSCCYASRLADGSYGCDDSSTPLNLTLQRKWKPGKITSKPVGEPTQGEKEERQREREKGKRSMKLRMCSVRLRG